MDIAKLKALLAAATPGPWECEVFRGEDISIESHGIELGMVFAGKNAALIVAAVNDLPSLIARVEAAESVVGAARQWEAMIHNYPAEAEEGLSEALAIYNKGAC